MGMKKPTRNMIITSRIKAMVYLKAAQNLCPNVCTPSSVSTSSYFWYEEYDEVDTDDGVQTFGQRFWAAFKYTIAFILLVIIIFLVGFFIPIIDRKGAHMDLDY